MENSEKKTETKTENTGRPHHVLVCISASPTSRTVIRAAASAAGGSRFSALYVGSTADADSRRQLEENMAYAVSHGARMHVLKMGSAEEIASFARGSGITDVYIGKSGSSKFLSRRGTFLEKLMHALPEARLHVVPDAGILLMPSRLKSRGRLRFTLRDLMITLAVMAVATVISLCVDRSSFSNANIITIYILAVLIAAVMTADRIYGVVAAVLYILVFNLLFIEPRFSLQVYGRGYTLTYFVTVISALLTGTVAARMKASRAAAVENAYQTKVLLECSELLQHARTEEDMTALVCNQLVRLLHRSVICYPAENGKLLPPMYFHMDGTDIDAEKEKPAAQWVLENNHQAGAFTSHFSGSSFRYLAVRVGENIYGIIGIHMARRLTDSENNILLSLVGECALSIENYRNIRERERAEAAAENERFRASILRSISHDLRTPLTSISGNATNLMHNEAELGGQERQQMYADIHEDAQWLISLTENLLSMTRLEEAAGLNLRAEAVSEIVEEALRHVSLDLRQHTIETEESDEVLLVYADARLIIQVIINLVTNAVKYTPPGSRIRISASRRGGRIWVSVSDDGPGISRAQQEHLFEMFYTCHNSVADSRRSLGLGLGLCRAIMKAHGEQILYEENRPHGSVFRFSLKEARIDEQISDSVRGG